MTDSTTTAATTSDGTISAKNATREHPVAVLRRHEGQGLIGLATDALDAVHDLAYYLHKVLHGPQGVVPVTDLKAALSNARACLQVADGYLGQLDTVLDSAVPPDWEPPVLEPATHW